MEELELVCQEAARGLVARGDDPVLATVVLPLPDKTRVTSLPEWPEDDNDRQRLLQRFSDDVVVPANAPCYGFVAEAIAATDGPQPVDVVVVVFGARGHHPRITAAPLYSDGVGDFTPSESVAPGAMPFLAPLQQAVDRAAPPDAFSG